MDDSKKTESGLNRSHFATLHDKIQNKYIEMQRKLHKNKLSEPSLDDESLSKSTDNLLSDIFDITKNVNNSVKCEIIIEQVQENQPKVVYLTRSESILTLDTVNENDLDELNANTFSGDNRQSSFESLNFEELQEFDSKFEDTSSQPPTPPAKVSIRDRIGFRIANVKEKRRSNSTGKIAAKEKRKGGLDKVEKFILSNSTKDPSKALTNQKRVKVGVVTVALIDASGWETDEGDKPRVLHCRLRLGAEKIKSKSVKTQKTTVNWQEIYNFNWCEENFLDISLWDRDVLIGRTLVNLLELEKEKTHKMRLSLEGEVGNVQIFVLLTISASVNSFDTDEPLETNGPLEIFQRNATRLRKWNSFSKLGWLFVSVHGAKGLSHQDCYCVVEIGNERRMTPTEPKTCDPNWMKTFTFYVPDITDIIHFTIYEERKSEEIGKVSIPLLNIRNGENVYYTLKDHTQRERAKGNNARILLEMRITWNLTRAALRVINPKEEKFLKVEEKLDRHLFAKNLSRMRTLYSATEEILKFWKSSFEWHSKRQNLIGIMIWLPFCYCFKTWMWPLLLLIPFIWYRPQKYWIIKKEDKNTQESATSPESEKEDKISLVQKIINITDMIQNVQNTIGKLASFGESVKNLFNFKVPFLSWIAITAIVVLAIVLYFLPANYLLIIWGIHKFTRRMFRPNLVPNNEVLDLLSRVPDDETLLNCAEILPNETDDDKK